ncbi:hypothetical protein ACN38_g12277, partial [Penicillium nordicum]
VRGRMFESCSRRCILFFLFFFLLS